MTSTQRYCVIVPAFNAADTIGPLVSRIREAGLLVIVVDDGSTDRTAARAPAPGALVISHLRNRGKGAALRTGFAHAVRERFDGVVTMDSDAQHDPADIASLIRAGEYQHAALVLGNRMTTGAGMPRIRRTTNAVMSGVLSRVLGQPVPDSQCGFRVIRREVLESCPLRSNRFELETELLLAAAARRWKIISVPVRTGYAAGGTSHIRPLSDGVRFIGLVLRYLLWRW